MSQDEVEYNSWLLKRDNGELSNVYGLPEDTIEISNSFIEEGDLMTAIFGDSIEITHATVEEIANKAMLMPSNDDVHALNDKILSQVKDYSVAFLNSLNPTGMPSHELKLKPGAVIMLLRNLNRKRGLCNGTRLYVKTLKANVLHVVALNGKAKGQRVLILRIDLTSKDKHLPVQMQGSQIPVMSAFAMTINKSQVQSLDIVGIYLLLPVFSRGLLYVAFSRGRKSQQIRVKIFETQKQGTVTHNDIVNNIVAFCDVPTISLRKSLCVTATNDQAPAGKSLVAEESPELYFVAGSPADIAGSATAEADMETDVVEEQEAEGEEQEVNKSEPEYDDDELDELPTSRSTSGTFRGMIFRKASQTSVYLQEWDIPFEQIELEELIGQGRWGKVYRGRWHGEVAIRLLEIDGNNQDHLKLFKKEVMNYRQTRHENVVLFMGACMHPPHLAIITSYCKGRTLHAFVRDPKASLDINKTRQIAQEIIKGMGYLHAKGIVHKDLKSKNVFYENGKVIITDFGLFGISGVVQEGRRENELKLSHDWLCFLAPEIVREMAPGKDEDKLPFSKAADVYAFGTVWYELQARDWPFKSQAAEALIWQVGSGEGVKQVLSTISLGKEVTEILAACWSFDFNERPSFTILMDMLEKLPKLNRRLSHPGHFWKSADINSSKSIPRFERFGLGALEQGNQKI
ncbi:unnamed protein product [Ranitomeya imitator]|uniref:Protein kinase domain-containing protein n=1 Tax=Ranitomeya imitator TaxID=111125 RepID=A0ABN9M388_9NEOB|nr:unnamed protein product [Ranitomeya imitator]